MMRAPDLERPTASPPKATSERPRRIPSLGLKVALTIVAVATFAGAFASTFSVFSGTTSNTDNTFTTGTVILGDNDLGVAMLALPAAKPGNSDTSCIRVSYTGSLAAAVSIYGTTTGTGLDAYLTLTVTRGTGANTFDSCTGFTADATNYLGSGNGIIYTGSLTGFPDTFAGAIVDPKVATPESWTTSETHDYRFVITVDDNNSAQGLTATQTFTWEARNS